MTGTDFFVLAGFLGSGKTTLLLDFLETPEAAGTAVLVNDVGAVDVDGAVVAGITSGIPTLMLSNGCVCCSVGNELVETVDGMVADRAAAGLPPFHRIVLECSGLSRPGPVIRALADLGAHDFRVRVLATFDAAQGTDHAAHFEEAAAQLAAAQAVVLSKLDRPGAPSAAAGTEAVRAINPLARIVAEPDRGARARAAFAGGASVPLGPVAADAVLGGLRAMRHPRIGVFLATVPTTLAWDDLAMWIEDLAASCGDRLLRVKGLVTVADSAAPLLIQGVGTVFSPPRRMPPDTLGRRDALVIIATDLDAAALRAIGAGIGITVTAT